MLLEDGDHLGNGGTLLADSDVDAVKRLGLVSDIVASLLVKDGVDSDSGLASLAITNNELTLATANRHLF